MVASSQAGGRVLVTGGAGLRHHPRALARGPRRALGRPGQDGDITRDFVYIDDVVSALVAAVASPPEDHMRTVDVGSGVRTTIGDLAREIARYHSAPEPHVTGQFRDGDVRHASCTVDATVEALDWSPAWSLRDGVAGLQEWISKQLD